MGDDESWLFFKQSLYIFVVETSSRAKSHCDVFAQRGYSVGVCMYEETISEDIECLRCFKRLPLSFLCVYADERTCVYTCLRECGSVCLKARCRAWPGLI